MKNQWHLYEDEGWEVASQEITRGYNLAKQAINQEYGSELYNMTARQIGDVIYSLYAQHIEPICKSYQEFGAWDTESREAIFAALADYVKRTFNKTAKF